MGNIYAQIRNYPEAISHLRSAEKIRPDIDSITQKIKRLEQRKIYLADLQAQFPDTNPQDGIKVYSKEMRRSKDDPDLLFGKSDCVIKQLRKKSRQYLTLQMPLKNIQTIEMPIIQRGQIYEATNGSGESNHRLWIRLVYL